MNLSIITTLLFISTINVSEEVLDMSAHVKSRQKRFALIWRPGINWVQVVIFFFF